MENPKLLAKHLKDLYFGGNWTSVNLKDLLSKISVEKANKKIGNHNSILALAYHINYYVLAQTKVLQGGPLDSKDKFSFDHPAIETEEAWQNFVIKTLDDCTVMVSLLEALTSDELDKDFAGTEKYGSNYRNFLGLIEHSHYHLGQIALLSKLLD